jgi:hypothetical protein
MGGKLRTKTIEDREHMKCPENNNHKAIGER